VRRPSGARKDDPSNPQSTERDQVVRDALAFIDDLFRTCRRSETLDELRGYEGAATARYFSAWARFLPGEFPFERRSTRPPLNPVNACISFGSTLLYNEFAALCHARGLDPALGLLHATEDGRWSLPLDLLEPFRPALVEALDEKDRVLAACEALAQLRAEAAREPLAELARRILAPLVVKAAAAGALAALGDSRGARGNGVHVAHAARGRRRERLCRVARRRDASQPDGRGVK
jgi:hypothetical protein